MVSVVLVVLFLLYMKCITITTSLDFVSNHQDLGARGSNVSHDHAAKKFECLNKERDALLLFKAEISDDTRLLSSWSSRPESSDCCNWWGVHCSTRTGHVIKLHLQGSVNISSHYIRMLSGKISSSLLQLPHLNSLDLSHNAFSDQPIPDFIGSLTGLKQLNLSNSGFGGAIPPQLGNISSLNFLDLSHNFFSGQPIPDFISSLTELKHLDLSSCFLNGTIPPQLGNLSNLTYLAVQENSDLETNLVEWLPRLTSLRYLNMDFVDLSAAVYWVDIIKSLPLLSHLSFRGCRLPIVVYPSPSLINSSGVITDLDLSDNFLGSPMFHWLFNLSTSLVSLKLSSNQLEGPIPLDFGKFTSLESLDLSYNQLEGGIPKSFRNLCSLQTLDLGTNNISGNFAYSVNNLQSGCAVGTLTELDVSENNLTGSLPDNIVRFSTSLKTLKLANNRLNGSVSENLGKLSQLEMLDLSFNSLSGNLSEAHFSNLHNLVHLDLSFNSLALVVNSSWIPSFQLVDLTMNSCKPGPNSLDWIQTQRNLTSLDVANCGISANMPASFWDLLTSVNYLNLSSNEIRGKVPDFPSDFGNPTSENGGTIDLSSNLLEGPIPLLPSSVETLSLSKNNFSGSLSVLCQSTEKGLLTFLDLSHNSLNGSLPDCLMQFTGLLVLNLAYNNFSQNIPNSIGSLVSLLTLDLHDNNFSGELPLSLRNCTSLSFLNVGENKLSGNIPAWIGEELGLLYLLSLRSNNFSGLIPLRLCQLSNLQILDLSVNSFFGSIPPCLDTLIAMVNVNSSSQVSEHGYASDYYREYFDSALVEWQGREREFVKNLGLLKIIDLSGNRLTGEVPNAITNLRGLVVLNLSRNKLHGTIPEEIGQLESLLSLNFSRNEFSGRIPHGMAVMSFLSNLDLSHNNFSGRIPPGRQLETLDPSAFAENAGLCGPPLTQKCPGDELPPVVVARDDDHHEGDDEFLKWLFISMSTGFITGFWAICGALLLNRRCRHAFFRLFDSLNDSIYVKVAILFRNRRV